MRVRPPAARTAVATAFALNGLAYAALLSRVPAVRETLGLSVSELGLLLLSLSAGTVLALPASGLLVQRAGAARVVAAGAVAVLAAFGICAVGLTLISAPLVAVGLLVYGAGTSSWDVAMNLEGAEVERRLGRVRLPRLHAAFSVGTVFGAGLGAAAARVGVGPALQLVALAPVLALVVGWAVSGFLPTGRGRTDRDRTAPVASLTAAWLDGRTLAVGVLALAFALAEGVANDWLAVAFVEGHGTSDSVGALGFAAFVTAMTLGRVGGGALVDRFGRVAVLRTTALLVAAGGVLVAAAPLGAAWPGAALWGLGASLGFPLSMSAAADDPAWAAVRVSVVASLGYAAFLAGPPLIGFLAEESGILVALLTVMPAVAVLGLLAAPSAANRTLRHAQPNH